MRKTLLLAFICVMLQAGASGFFEDTADQIVVSGQAVAYGSEPHTYLAIRTDDAVFRVDKRSEDILQTLDSYMYEFVLESVEGNKESAGLYTVVSYTRIE